MTYQLEVQLNGVCVHVGPQSGLEHFDLHRAVYPGGSVEVDGFLIDAHAPTMKIENAQGEVVAEPPIKEATVSFSTDNVTNTGFSGTMCCAPHLHFFFPWLTLDPDKVLNQGLTNGAYIDFTVGEIHGRQVDGAACTRVILEYDVPSTVVTITPWASQIAIPIPVTLPATIVIHSDATHHRVLDYYLTFEVANQAGRPPENILAGQVGQVINFINACLGGEGDAGCSNSQFP